MNKNIIYYHIFAITNWLEIVKEQIDLMVQYDLLKNSILRIGVLYTDPIKIEEVKDFFSNIKNVEFLFFKENTNAAESETLGMLKDFSTTCENNFNIFYLHTKGVTQYGSVREYPVKKWRNMMEYFLIEKWQDCVQKLNEGYDCCGINYQNHAANIKGELKLIKIYNGNFFWTKTDYVKRLDKSILYEHRYSSENWITSSKPNAYSFYDTPINIDLYYQINENYK
jgi:hypothetical protein